MDERLDVEVHDKQITETIINNDIAKYTKLSYKRLKQQIKT